MKNLIGVTGHAGAGKDTVCDMAIALLNAADKRATKIACADPLKEICSQVFSVAPQCFTGTQEQKDRPFSLGGATWTGRRILQHIGTEGFGVVQPDAWARIMYSRAQALFVSPCPPTAVFVSDIRMRSEENIIHANGGIIIRVRHPDADQVAHKHATETELSTIQEDYVLDNQGGPLPRLKELVHKLLIHLELLT